MHPDTQDRCLCAHLRRAAGAMTRFYDQTMAPSGLTISQYVLLRSLTRLGSSSITTLALQMRLDRSTLARNLRPLLRMAYVEDMSQPGARDCELRVTSKGAAALAAAHPLWQDAQRMMKERIGEENLSAFWAALASIENLPAE